MLLIIVSSFVFVLVNGEAGFIAGPPPTSFVTHGKPLSPPLSARPYTKIIDSYVSSEYSLYGGTPSPHPSPSPSLSKVKAYSSPQNALPIEVVTEHHEHKEQPFEVVRAPVIYHHTVSDTDVSQALADAFDKLRKPNDKGFSSDFMRPSIIPLANIEYVSRFPDKESHRNPYATTTTTIVEAPQNRLVGGSNSASIVNPGHVSITTDQIQLPPIPAAADLPPAAAPTLAVISDEPVAAAPITTTSTASILLAGGGPKLIIPNQQHVTTLAEAVKFGEDSKVRTIIQPVYIPYPVDQNGQPIGPLPDYQTMDFNALLSAQKQLVFMSSPVTNNAIHTSTPSVQSVHIESPPVQHHRQYYTYQTVEDQGVAAASPTLATAVLPPPTLSSLILKKV